MSLKNSIRETERDIVQRRDRLGVAFNGVTRAVSTRMVSPGALVTAGLVGAALHRNKRMHLVRVLALLQAANAGLARLVTLSSWMRSSATTR